MKTTIAAAIIALALFTGCTTAPRPTITASATIHHQLDEHTAAEARISVIR